MGKVFDSVLSELRRLGKSAADLADSLEAMEAAEPETAAAETPRVSVIDVTGDMNLRAWLDELLAASAECLVKGDGFGPSSYRILPPTPQALEKLETVRARIARQLEEAGYT